MNLAIRDLSKTYLNGTQALKGVSLDIPPGMIDPYRKLIDLEREDNVFEVRRAVE